MPISLPSPSPLARRWLIGAAIVLAVVVTGFLAFSVGDLGGPDASGDPSDSDRSSAHGTAGDGAGDGDGGSDEPGDGGASPGSDPNGGVEVLPPSPSQSGLPGLEPPDLSALVSRPLPATAAARDRLVKGYPRKAIPPAPQSAVATSSVSPNGQRLQVALTADTKRSPGQVIRFYRDHLAKLGFAEQPSSVVGGSEGAAFTRGKNSVTIVASDSSYAVTAILIAED